MNMWSMLVNFDTSHFGMSPFSDKTLKKMADMPFTIETSHSDISPSNEFVLENVTAISSTPNTLQRIPTRGIVIEGWCSKEGRWRSSQLPVRRPTI